MRQGGEREKRTLKPEKKEQWAKNTNEMRDMTMIKRVTANSWTTGLPFSQTDFLRCAIKGWQSYLLRLEGNTSVPV